MKKFNLYLPGNLNASQIINRARQEFQEIKLKESKLLYICSAIINARSSQRKEMEENDTIYAPVCSQKLDEVVHNYREHLDALLITQIIDTDNHFIPGKKCKGYSFMPPYSGQPIKEVEVKDYTLRRSMKKAAKNHRKKQKKALKGYEYLTIWWDEPGLEIDLDRALQWLEEYRDKRLYDIIENADIADRDILVDNLADTYEDFKRQVISIHSGDFSYGFSGASRRFYNPITNLKKELRAFLTFNGQPLVELDKKNSQPYFSLALLMPSFWQKRCKDPNGLNLKRIIDKEIYRRMGRDEGKGRGIQTIDAIIRLLKNEETQASKGIGGFHKYKEFVTGDFYQHMEDIFKPLYPDRFDNRSNVKKEVLRILYMDPKKDHLEFHQPCKTFEGHFPYVYWLFSKIKEIDYTDLAIILQRIESFLFIDVICKRIHQEYPHIPMFTIHDCILTTMGNEETVKQIIEEELLHWIGYPATLHCKAVTAMPNN